MDGRTHREKSGQTMQMEIGIIVKEHTNGWKEDGQMNAKYSASLGSILSSKEFVLAMARPLSTNHSILIL